MILLLKFGLLFISVTGYVLFATQRFHLRIEFAPALFCAWSSNALFVGGILNILPQMAWAVLFGGVGLFLISGRRRYRFSRRAAASYAVFLAVLLYFFWLMRGVQFTSYDNFSHWATVVKDMLLKDRMPNFEDTIIRFQSYPLGSSLFIYYICRILGLGEPCFLWAQFVMLSAFLFCLAAFIQKKCWYGALFPALYAVWALTANNSIYELRVDTLLPLAGIAAFALICYYKDEPSKAVYGSMGLFILMVNIKNSGLFFYAACLLALAASQKQYFKRHKWRLVNACLLPVGVTIYLWKRHVALVFADGMASKHAMSMENYGQQLAKKTTGDIVRIGAEMMGRFSSLEHPEVYMMLVFTFLAGMLLLIRVPMGRVLRLAAACWGCLAVYTVCLYGMYLFSMPLGEALKLASYDRYMLSVLIFIYGIVVIFIVRNVTARKAAYDWDEKADIKSDRDMEGAGAGTSGRLKKGGVVAGCVGVAFLVLLAACPVVKNRMQLFRLYQKPQFESTKRACMQELIRRAGIEEGGSCFIYCNGSDDDRRYLFYLARYELWSADVVSVHKDTFAEQKGQMENYDYLLVWDADPQIDQYLQENGLARDQGQERVGIRLRVE